MHKIASATLIMVSIVLESALLPFFSIAGVVPNITMILVISLALRHKNVEGALIGLLAGLTKDMVVGRIIGISGITYMLIAYFIGCYKDKIFPDHLTTPLVLTTLATVMHESIYLLFIFFLGFQVESILTVIQVWLVQGMYNFLLALPVHTAVRKVFQWHRMKKQWQGGR